MTVEEAVLQGRLDNFENFKTNYVDAIHQMIAALEALANAQAQADAMAATSGGGYDADAAISDWNSDIQGKIASSIDKGKDVWYATGDDGKLHYSTISKERAEKFAGGNSATKIPGTKLDPNRDSGVKGSLKSTSKKTTKGNAQGSDSLPSTDFYHINELGDELLIPPTGNLAYLSKGTGIVPAHLTDNLMDLGQYNMSQWAKLIGGAMGGNSTDSHDIVIQNMTVQSDNANDFVRQLQNLSILKK